jgi:cytochrome b6-f complex iron-sulfur subunit
MDPQKPGIWSRRDFFSRIGWAGFGVVSFLSLIGFLRSAFPRVLFQPPSTFKAGFPSDYTAGEVSDKFKQDYRVWIVREDEGFYALFAKCTHLGCTPNWLQAVDKFKCPCHGSGYYKSGLNFEGPAPRPLDRFQITIAEDGQLLVDKSMTFKMQAGAEPDEQYPQSILKA